MIVPSCDSARKIVFVFDQLPYLANKPNENKLVTPTVLKRINFNRTNLVRIRTTIKNLQTILERFFSMKIVTQKGYNT